MRLERVYCNRYCSIARIREHGWSENSTERRVRDITFGTLNRACGFRTDPGLVSILTPSGSVVRIRRKSAVTSVKVQSS